MLSYIIESMNICNVQAGLGEFVISVTVYIVQILFWMIRLHGLRVVDDVNDDDDVMVNVWQWCVHTRYT